MNVSRRQLRFLIESADVDDNFYIDKEEFLTLIQKHSGQLEKIQQNNFLKYMRIAAYADEYRYFCKEQHIIKLKIPNLYQMVATSLVYINVDIPQHLHLHLSCHTFSW